MSTHSMNRRELLRTGVLGAGAFYLAPGLVSAQLSRRAAGADQDNVLVVIQLSGGNDGLNTVVPFGVDDYHRVRGTLRIRKSQCFEIDDELGFNRQLQRLKSLYDVGQLAVVQGVGYPGADRSHFRSMDIWHSADPSLRNKTTGWLGRMADVCCAGAHDPDFTINVSTDVPMALIGTGNRPVSFVNPGGYGFRGSREQMPAFAKMTAGGDGADALLDLVANSARDARVSSAAIRERIAAYQTPVDYPGTSLANGLRRVAALIASDLSTRVYYVFHTGFDTHTNQAPRQNRLLGELNAALRAFQMDLDHSNASGRVATMMFSEFGRRVAENGSRGTDHGTAGPVFIAGDKVRGGLHGEHPDLADLDQGDLRYTTDFRSVYASLLQDWMGVDPAAVLGGRFPTLELF